MDLIFLVRHKERSMEHVIDLPCFGEAELIHDWREDFNYHEGPFTFWGELRVNNEASKISDF